MQTEQCGDKVVFAWEGDGGSTTKRSETFADGFLRWLGVVSQAETAWRVVTARRHQVRSNTAADNNDRMHVLSYQGIR